MSWRPVAVPAIAEAIATSPGRRVYVANLRAAAGGDGRVRRGRPRRALAAHGVGIDVVVADTASIALGKLSVPVVEAELGQGQRSGP